jgi:hypothetical protein
VVDSLRLGRDEHPLHDISGNGAGRGSGKRPRSNGGGNGNRNGSTKSRPGEPEDETKDKTKGRGRGRGKDKGKMRTGRRLNFNTIVKGLTPKEQQRHLGEQLCYKCHKPGHRLSKFLELQGESSSKADKQD